MLQTLRKDAFILFESPTNELKKFFQFASIRT